MPWTEADIPDQTGRVALVTGANSGIGFEAAPRARRARRGRRARRAGTRRRPRPRGAPSPAPRPTPTSSVLELDLADLDQVTVAAAAFAAGHDRLDLLINNAGLMAIPHQTTVQGYEMQLGVNHLAHFALTGRLLDRLLATPDSRVVSISSQGHRPGRIAFDDLQSEQSYGPWKAYFQSKLANLLFIGELQRRLTARDASTLALAAHPGGSRTNLGHENPGGIVNTLGHVGRPLIERLFLQPAAMGALPTLRAATDPAVVGGEYFGPDGLGEQRGHPKVVGRSRRAQDPEVARRLWAVSEELTGVRYAPLDA